MIKKMFDKKFLIDELDLPWNVKIVVHSKIVDHSRWSVIYELVFAHDGAYWRTTYSVAATESQDESPWDDKDQVECVKVEKRVVEKSVWVAASK